ncbi:MAG: hypothetical protein HGA75_01005 [Thiobacillus sp.]|nr:hypothetical protein [Thiobacillus sp.]
MSRQNGQALPLALVMLVAVASVVFFMFNSGQLVQEKIRLTNTADAVAYSAGVFEARALNYDAYTNRAIVANEIAIGQAVGLASWAKYAGTASANIAPYLYLIPYAGPAIANAMEQVADVMDMITYAYAAAVTLHDGSVQALALSQFAVHGPGNALLLANRLAVMRDVARRNDPDAEVDPIPLADDFAGFTQRYTGRKQRARMGKVVHDDRDAFLKRRNWQFGLVLKVIGCRVGSDIKKRGSTELIDLTEGWKSMDTLSFHKYWMKIKLFGRSCKHSETPIGYGSAFSDDGLDDSSYSYAGSRSSNPRASSMAEYTVANGFEPYTLGGGGIPPFHELAEAVLKTAGDAPRTGLAIRVTKAAARQRYSGGSGTVRPSGALDLYDGRHADNQSAAMAGVEVYFERPDGKNGLSGKEEYGSLFNPYWQARLVPVTAASRALAQMKQGLALP